MFAASSRPQFIEQPSFVDDPSTLAFAGRDRHRPHPHGPRATLRRPQGSPIRQQNQQQPRQQAETWPTQTPSFVRGLDDSKRGSPTPTAPLSPRSLVSDIDDPAFSTDPASHPDHNYGLELGVSSARDVRVGRQLLVNPDDLCDEPPTYEESISSNQDRQERSRQDMRSISNENLNVLVTPASPSIRPVSFTPPEDEGTDLPYLHDDAQNELQQNSTSGIRRDSLLPPGVQAPLNPSRRASEPPRSSPEPRPQIAPRGFTSPPARPAELDRIDELDESGLGLHHRGPYEVNGQLIAPPRRALPFQRDQEPFPSIQNFGGRPLNLDVPPPPMPYRLNLQPGQILPRMPPENSAIRQRDPLAPMAAYAPQAQIVPSRSRSSSGRTLPKDPENIIYYEPRESPSPAFPTPSPVPSRMSSRRPSPSSFYSASNENADYSTRSPPMPEPEVVARHSSYEPVMRPAFQLTPSVASAPSFMSSRSNLERPIRGAELHRPRQLVMPAPLQGDSRPSHNVPGERPFNNFIPSPPPQALAATIPIHPSKRGNLLKKRPTISARAGASGEYPRAVASDPSPSSSKAYRHSLAALPAEATTEKERRISRRLSKKRNV